MTVHLQVQPQFDWIVKQEKDEELMQVKQWAVTNQAPEYEQISIASPIIKSLWKEKELLQLTNGILTHTDICQIVIPKHCKSDVIAFTHSQGHFGILRTKLSV
jgi:hypothetical protein